VHEELVELDNLDVVGEISRVAIVRDYNDARSCWRA
jgi:hypothetical protein